MKVGALEVAVSAVFAEGGGGGLPEGQRNPAVGAGRMRLPRGDARDRGVRDGLDVRYS